MSDQPNPTPATTPPPIPAVLPTAHQTDASPGWVDPRTGLVHTGGKVPVSLLQEALADAKKHADEAATTKAKIAEYDAQIAALKAAADEAATKGAASTAFALMAAQFPDLGDADVQRVVTEAAANFAKRNAKDGKAPTVAEVLASEDFRKSPVVRAYFAPAAPVELPKVPARPAPPDPNAGTTSRTIGKPLTDADFAGMTPAQASANRAALEEHLRAKGHVFRPKK